MSIGLRALNAILAQGSKVKLRDLDESWFTDRVEQRVYNFLNDYVKRYHALPAKEIVETETRATLPANRRSTYNGDDLPHWIDKCKARHLQQTIIPIARAIKDEVVKPTPDPDILGRIGRQIMLASRGTSRYKVAYDSADIAHEFVQAADDARFRGIIPGIPTGFPMLDDQYSYWRPGELSMFVARPGVGKTNMLLRSIITAIETGARVTIASMEVPPKRFAQYLACHLLGVNPHRLKTGRITNVLMEKIREGGERIASLGNIQLLNGQMGATLNGLDSYIQEHQADILFIDGLYLLKSDDNPRLVKRTDKMEVVTSETKRYAMSYDIPVVASSQMGRGATKELLGGSLDNIGYSDAVGTDCATIIGISSPKDFIGEDDDRRKARLMTILKGREGEEGTWLNHYTFEPMNFGTIRTLSKEEIDTYLDEQKAGKRGGGGEGSAPRVKKEPKFDWSGNAA